MYDLVVRNGLVVDGTGEPGFRGDVAVRDGRIVAVGAFDGQGARELDAAGRVVAPGFIDPHTHFDVQLLWDGAAKPALEHGVTCVVPGNCSLTLAPLRIEDRAKVVGMFQQIEEMPPEAFTQAFDWSWEDFAGYRDAIAAKLSINVAPLVGHSVLRLWVMGDAAQERTATPAELTAMQSALRECLDAGAIGLSTSFVDLDEHGRPVPSRYALPEELHALAAVLGEQGRMLQCVPEFYDTDITVARIDQMAELSLAHGIPTTVSPVFDRETTPNDAPRILARIAEHAARGARVWPQMQTRPIDISFSLRRPSLYFLRLPRWTAVMKMGPDARLAALKDPEMRRKLLADLGPDGGEAQVGHLIVRGGGEAPEHLAGRTLRDVAAERHQTPGEALIDLSVEHDMNIAFLASGIGHDSTARIGPMLADRLTHVGASDGGAHIMSFSTYGDTGYLFSEFVRKSGHLTLEQAVQKITGDTADIWGLGDRGRILAGKAADLVIFDPDTIDRGEERAIYDMPGDGLRYVRGAIGVDTVVVNGEVAYAQGAYTNSRSGQVVH